MQVLGSDVRFAAAHKHCWGPVTGEQRLRVAVQCGAENRGEQESVSPGSREVAIVTPKPALSVVLLSTVSATHGQKILNGIFQI